MRIAPPDYPDDRPNDLLTKISDPFWEQDNKVKEQADSDPPMSMNRQ
jgi:hypothetical protein